MSEPTRGPRNRKPRARRGLSRDRMRVRRSHLATLHAQGIAWDAMDREALARELNASRAEIDRDIRTLRGTEDIHAGLALKQTGLVAAEETLGTYERVKRLLDACESWLLVDGKIELGPRTTEIAVDILDERGECVGGRKRTLAELLEIAREALPEDHTVRLREARTADVRKLFLETASELRASLELIARFNGELKPGDTNLTIVLERASEDDIAATPAARAFVARVYAALEPFPEALAAVRAAVAPRPALTAAA
jgi:hypothetical protein